MNKKSIAILVPMYNEEESIPLFFPAIQLIMKKIDVDYQIICVDDGSNDQTLPLLRAVAACNERVKVISLSRNFGKEPAMTAALEYSNCDAVIPIDADLQDPPELIIDMIEKWKEGFDVVYAKRICRKTDTLIKRNTSGIFYKLFNNLSKIKIPENVGDYRLMDQRVVEALKALPERERFMKGLFCWPGFKNCTIEFTRQERAAGNTKFNYWNLWNFALSGITSFSTLPIRLGIYVGFFVSLSSFLFGIWIIAKTLITGVDTPGYASMMAIILFLGGLQIFFMGLLGEYIGRIYSEVKGRPIYWVKETVGFDKKN